MAGQKDTIEQEEVLLDVKVAEASKLYKFYLLREKKIFGASAVILFLILWEFMGGASSELWSESFMPPPPASVL